MRALSEARLLTIWETAVDRPSVSRALALATAGGAPGPNVVDLSIGRRDEYIWALRQDCFGEALSSVVDCPSCGAELELELVSSQVHVGPPASDGGCVPVDDIEIDFRLITSRDLLAVAGRSDARREVITRCVTGVSPKSAAAFPDSALSAVSAAIAALDPQADASVDVECAVCAHCWSAPFDIASYLWGELNVHAVRVLREVHSLATAYGWTEAEVLAVSPARRRRYLEMAEP
jgi:hypothetical protein